MRVPGGAELLVLLLTTVLFVGFVVGVVLLVKRIAGTNESKTTGVPDGQRPPPGYWWDGEKWNPPADQ